MSVSLESLDILPPFKNFLRNERGCRFTGFLCDKIRIDDLGRFLGTTMVVSIDECLYDSLVVVYFTFVYARLKHSTKKKKGLVLCHQSEDNLTFTSAHTHTYIYTFFSFLFFLFLPKLLYRVNITDT